MDPRFRHRIAVGLLLLLLAACRQAAAPVEDPAQPDADASAAPSAAAPSTLKNPDTWVTVGIADPIRTLDPAAAYDSGSGSILFNIYETLVFWDGDKPDRYVPLLASELPTTDNGLLGDGGRTYVFPIRDGITFSQGPVLDAAGATIPGSGVLEAADVAYTLQRGMLQNRAAGPQSLFLDPLLGVNSILDLARKIEAAKGGKSAEDVASLDDVGPETLEAVCQSVKASVSAEGNRVTFKLQEPFAPFPQILAGYWASILDSEWVKAEIKGQDGSLVKRAGWDGECAHWRDFYDPKLEESELFSLTNGTGPYLLQEWRKEEQITLVRREDYWRERPAHIRQVVMKFVPEWSTRLLMLEAGDADAVAIPQGNRDQVRPLVAKGILKETGDLPSPSMSFFNLNESVVAENNPYIGSGTLDGAGIPPDFFADIDVRKGFAYSFDWETYIRDGLDGDGTKAKGPIPSKVAGHDPNVPGYDLDLDKAAEHFNAAFGGRLAQVGFQLVVPVAPGSTAVQTAYQIYEQNLARINPKFKLIIQETQATQITQDNEADRIPFRQSAWREDYHDPHNWAYPILGSTGYYGRLMNLPSATQGQLDELILAARREQDPAARAKLYARIQRMSYDEALIIPLTEGVGRAFEPSYLHGVVRNASFPGSYYWHLQKGP